MIRVAAIGDVHFGVDAAGMWAPHWSHVGEDADLLLLAGDLSRRGLASEARALCEELRGIEVPIVSVLGNHEYEDEREDEFRRILEQHDVTVLEGETFTCTIEETSIGIAGTIGFVGGFPGGSLSDFGERELKQVVARTRRLADQFGAALEELETDVRVGLLHYSPVRDTLIGEPPEIHVFLGSHMLGAAADRAGADLLVHGHAHHGTERGRTEGGIPVRNVAHPLVGAAYRVFELPGV